MSTEHNSVTNLIVEAMASATLSPVNNQSALPSNQDVATQLDQRVDAVVVTTEEEAPPSTPDPDVSKPLTDTIDMLLDLDGSDLQPDDSPTPTGDGRSPVDIDSDCSLLKSLRKLRHNPRESLGLDQSNITLIVGSPNRVLVQYTHRVMYLYEYTGPCSRYRI